ncbi:class IV adenylate cyclase [Herbaspirillum camelliae]|uniref:class IV adenylate cyclase n=1 Tax=Herbaspirillum camelliae TaxID=1892903 RepID=UPI000949D22C|nr:class IV adenylate cyclase [Herbaspirillum camelliae]
MARNVEIKARLSDLAATLERVREMADRGPVEIEQDDTFFNCDNGRLKLRQISPNEGSLIFYRRVNQIGPKESFFVHSATATPDSLREVLSLAYGEGGRVIKHRTLFHIGRTRIHIDRVQGLGSFLELEVMLSDGELIEAGVIEAEKIMENIGVIAAQLIDKGYVDLLIEAQKT